MMAFSPVLVRERPAFRQPMLRPLRDLLGQDENLVGLIAIGGADQLIFGWVKSVCCYPVGDCMQSP